MQRPKVESNCVDTPLPAPVTAAGGCLLLIFSAYFYIEQTLHPPCCDATNYLELAQSFVENGLVETKAELRTFGYPLILAIIQKIGRTILLPPSFLLYLLQISAYGVAAYALGRSIPGSTSWLRSAVYIALCGNFFVLPYAGIPLTDSLYVSLSVALLASMLAAENAIRANRRISPRFVLAGSFLTCGAIVIRPASIWLAPLAVLVLFRLLLRRRVSFFEALFAVLLGALPLLVQVQSNAANFGLISFFPSVDLGSSQIKWGIENFKYSTWLGEPPKQNYYPTVDLLGEDRAASSLRWYLNNLRLSVPLVLAKLVGAFDFDFLVPYPVKLPRFHWLATFFSYPIFLLGIFGTVLHLTTGKLTALGPRYFPALVFVLWSGVTLVSALETRFTLPLLCYFILVSCILIHELFASRSKATIVSLAVAACCITPTFFATAKYVRTQSVRWK